MSSPTENNPKDKPNPPKDDPQQQPKDKPRDKPKRPHRRLKRFLFNAGLLLFCVGVIALIIVLVPSRGDEAPAIERPPVNVRVMVVQPLEQLADRLVLPAVVEPRRIVTVAAEVAGQVKAIPVEEGKRYDERTLIVQLDKELLQAEFDRASARANLAEQNYRRIANLHEGGAVTDRELDQASADLAVGKAELEMARVRLERADVYAPISGTVNRILVEEGEYVQQGTTVAEIVDMSEAIVVVKVPEMDVDFFATGGDANVLATVRGQEKVLPGTITYISKIAEERTRATRLEITVQNNTGILRSGHIVRAELLRRMLSDVIMIPLEAVIPLETEKAVFVVTDVETREVEPSDTQVAGSRVETTGGEEADEVAREEGEAKETARFGIARLREVELGIMRGRNVQITSGVAEGDLLIIAGQRYVGPGGEVRIIEGAERD